MSYQKYGQDRIRPAGEWVQATHLLEVAGLAFRKLSVKSFAHAVRKAEQRGLQYGLNLVREASNPHDPNAIAVFGVVEVRGLFRKKAERMHLGYVPADIAREMVTELMSSDVPLAAELYRIVEGVDDYFEIKFFVLAPPGYGVAKRERERKRAG